MIKQRRVLFAVLLLWTLAYAGKSTIGNPDEPLKSFFLGLADSLVLVGILYVVWNWVSKRRLLHARGLVRKIVFTLLLSWALLDAILSGLEAPKALESSAWVGVLSFFVSLGWSLIFVALTYLAWNWIAGFRARDNSAGLGKKMNKIYVDSGMALLHKLIITFNLPDWKELLPTYTEEEIEAINKSLSDFQKTADEVIGGSAIIHPEVVPTIQSKLASDALSELADKWKYSDELQTHWKDYVSTYLKAWAGNLSPLTLLNLGDLLVAAGHQIEAKNVFQLLLLFPTYADTYFYENPNARDLVEVRRFAKDITNFAKDRLNDLA